MAKAKKTIKQQPTKLMSPWHSNWADIDRAFDSFRRDLEKSFTSFPALKFHTPKFPENSCDVIDEGKQYRIKANMPGVTKNEITLNVTDNSVEISAEHKEKQEEKKKNFVRKERSELSYYRTIPLPEKVVSSKSKAKLSDGVLDITIPKITPLPKSKKKSIKVK